MATTVFPSTTGHSTSDGTHRVERQGGSGQRAPRPRTRQQIPASADEATVLLVDEQGEHRLPFIDDESRDIVEQLGGVQREPDWRSNPVNPPDGAGPAANLKNR
jgi:hypothetical protein